MPFSNLKDVSGTATGHPMNGQNSGTCGLSLSNKTRFLNKLEKADCGRGIAGGDWLCRSGLVLCEKKRRRDEEDRMDAG
jgi:hypothetical protein